MKNHLFARMWQWMCLLLLCSLPVTALAQEEEPMAVFHTNAYIQNGENNVISILIGSSEKDVTIEVDCGNGRQQYDVLPSTLNSETGTWDGTFITCNVSSQGVVKLYGDPSKIDVLMGDGCYFTDIDISKLTNLAILSLTLVLGFPVGDSRTKQLLHVLCSVLLRELEYSECSVNLHAADHVDHVAHLTRGRGHANELGEVLILTGFF